MLSTARAVFRPFLIVIVLAVCVCPLHLRAQETSSGCQIGEAAPLAGLFMAAAGPAQPSRRINPKILCGGAGQTYRASAAAGNLWSTTPITPGGAMLDEALSRFGARTIAWIDGAGVELLGL